MALQPNAENVEVAYDQIQIERHGANAFVITYMLGGRMMMVVGVDVAPGETLTLRAKGAVTAQMTS